MTTTGGACPPFAPCGGDPTACWDYDGGGGGSSPDNPGQAAVTSTCWTLVWALLGAGVVMVAYADHCLVRESPLEMLARYLAALRTRACRVRAEEQQEHQRDIDHAFVETLRTEENFLRDPSDPALVLPRSSENEYQPEDPGPGWFAFTTLSLLRSPRYLLYVQYIHAILIGSAGWGCLSSAASTLLWLALSREEYCVTAGLAAGRPAEQFVQQMADGFRVVTSNYQFLPTFLLVGYISYMLLRWRTWMVNCHRIQSGLHNVALLMGGAARPPVALPVRRKLFRVYRLLNLIHAETYRTVSPTVGPLDRATDYVTMGLITEDEVRRLAATQFDQIRAVALSWLVDAVNDLLASVGVVGEHAGVIVMESVAKLRGACGAHGSWFIKDNPNLYWQVMFCTVGLWLALILAGYPFSLLIYTDTASNAAESAGALGTACFQPMVLLGVFIMAAAIRTALMLVYIARNPFIWPRERIKVDNLLALSDRTMFAHIRSNFDGATGQPGEITRPAVDVRVAQRQRVPVPTIKGGTITESAET